MLLGLYRVATDLGSPLLARHLNRRARRGKEDPNRLDERTGRTRIARPNGPLLWVHAASVGESLAALPLIKALLAERPKLHVLMTTGTVTSAGLMAERLPDRAIHQFVPLDQTGAWRRFLDHWQPDLGCLVESEIWPNLILEAERANLPLALINGRMSPRSANRWRWGRSAASRLLGSLALCLARSSSDAERFKALGAVDVRTLGDLKNATPELPEDPAPRAELDAAIGDRPVWLAASTHPGEETDVAAVHRTLCQRHPDLLTIIVPRHPERGEQLAVDLSGHGNKVARRSANDKPDAATGIYIADTLGELGLFYRIASLAFIGGSLVPHGGQNPLEAARLGCPTLFGPHTGNFDEMTERLLNAGASRRVRDADELADAVDSLLGDPRACRDMATAARDVGATEGAVLVRVQQALTDLLNERLDRNASREPDHACA